MKRIIIALPALFFTLGVLAMESGNADPKLMERVTSSEEPKSTPNFVVGKWKKACPIFGWTRFGGGRDIGETLRRLPRAERRRRIEEDRKQSKRAEEYRKKKRAAIAAARAKRCTDKLKLETDLAGALEGLSVS